MTIGVDAVYEDGVLKLEHPVDLKDKTKVRVTIERVPHIPKGRSGKYRHVVSRVIVDPTSASEVKEN